MLPIPLSRAILRRPWRGGVPKELARTIGGKGMADKLNAMVTHRTEAASGLLILRVAPDGWSLPAWRSGQFAVLGLPATAKRAPLCDPEPAPADPDRLIRRAYSIASSSGETGSLEFYITLVRSGELTPRLFALEPGDRLFLGTKITGMFTLGDVPAGSDLVMIATGTGLAPYMSMLRSEVMCHPTARATVILGARHSWDLGYRGELIAMQKFCATFDYIPVISRPAEEMIPWSGETGYVQDVWQGGRLERAWGRKPDPSTAHVLLCGNPAMIESMIGTLQADGFAEHTRKQPGQIHVEKYW